MPDIGTGISAVASIAGSAISGSAAKDAAKTQANAVDSAAAASQHQFDQNRADLAPWRETGWLALSELSKALGLGGGVESFDQFTKRFTQPVGRDWLPQEMTNLQSQYAAYKAAQETQNRLNPQKTLLDPFTMADYQADPGYQFRLSEGQRGIQNGAAARGMQLSGATLKALNRYNSDLASQEYGAAYARDAANKERKFNMLSGVAGTGQTATNTTAALGANNAANIASLMTDRGNALAAGQVGASNAWSGGISDAFNNYQQSQLLNRLFPTTSPSSSGGFTNPTAFGGSNSLYVPRIA